MRSQHPKHPQWPKAFPPLLPPTISSYPIDPEESRGRQQQYLDVRRRFYTTPSFRKNICDLRRRYDAQYWREIAKWQRLTGQLDKELMRGVWKLLDRFWAKAGNAPVLPSIRLGVPLLRFHTEAEVLCRDFGLDERDSRWIEWLVRHWDPESSEMPDFELEPLDLRPNFHPCHIRVTDFFVANRRRITLVLEHGASPTAARDAAAHAVKALPSISRRKPTLTDPERERLCELFQHHGFNKKRAHAADFRTLAERMRQEIGPISEATVRKEYYKWAKRSGLPFQPREYGGAASLDRRP